MIAAIHLGGRCRKKAQVENNASWLEHSVCRGWAWLDVAFGTTSQWWAGMRVGRVGTSYCFK